MKHTARRMFQPCIWKGCTPCQQLLSLNVAYGARKGFYNLKEKRKKKQQKPVLSTEWFGRADINYFF